MSRLKWDEVGKKHYETGVSECALFNTGDDGKYKAGVAWDGLTGITASPSGADSTKLYANNGLYINLRGVEQFGGTIEAYTYPPEFAECDGSAELTKGVYIGQQNRRAFGLVYKTVIGVDSGANCYKLHFVYGGTASPSERAYSTINDNPEAITMSWDFEATPVPVTGFKPVAHLEVNSLEVDSEKLKAFEDIVYGKDPTSEGAADGKEPRLPLPDEIKTLMTQAA